METEQERIEKEFSEMLKLKMTDEEFWYWLSTWYDPQRQIETAIEYEELAGKKEILEEWKAGKFHFSRPSQTEQLNRWFHKAGTE